MPSEANDRESLAARYPGVQFGRNVQVIGLDSLTIGEGTTVAEDVWFNDCVRDGAIRIVIGRHCYVGRRSLFSSAGRLELGDHCLLGSGVYLGDVDHEFADITRPYAEQGVTRGNRLTVEENCWLGLGSMIKGDLTVGRGSVVGAGAVVLRDVPPFSLVVGLPARVIKLYNPETAAWERIASPADEERVLAARDRRPLPSREEYVQILRRNSALRPYHPALTGDGQCI